MSGTIVWMASMEEGKYSNFSFTTLYVPLEKSMTTGLRVHASNGPDAKLTEIKENTPICGQFTKFQSHFKSSETQLWLFPIGDIVGGKIVVSWKPFLQRILSLDKALAITVFFLRRRLNFSLLFARQLFYSRNV